jgi:RimJ/RimL family protein N-acetyltransferase
MTLTDLFRGERVRLAADDTQTLAEAYSRWLRDTEYWRLQTTQPARVSSVKAAKDWLDKAAEKDPPGFYNFSIHRLEDDRLIGDVGFDGIFEPHRDAYVGIALGERDCWDKGYGTDAMRLILRFGFSELNLHRVTLNVFEYNPRAIHTYEKLGFKHEGRICRFLNRDGRRWDLIYMGLLREEWEAHGNFTAAASSALGLG